MPKYARRESTFFKELKNSSQDEVSRQCNETASSRQQHCDQRVDDEDDVSAGNTERTSQCLDDDVTAGRSTAPTADHGSSNTLDDFTFWLNFR